MALLINWFLTSKKIKKLVEKLLFAVLGSVFVICPRGQSRIRQKCLDVLCYFFMELAANLFLS